jgi:hypothetical protein
MPSAQGFIAFETHINYLIAKLGGELTDEERTLLVA